MSRSEYLPDNADQSFELLCEYAQDGTLQSASATTTSATYNPFHPAGVSYNPYHRHARNTVMNLAMFGNLIKPVLDQSPTEWIPKALLREPLSIEESHLLNNSLRWAQRKCLLTQRGDAPSTTVRLTKQGRDLDLKPLFLDADTQLTENLPTFFGYIGSVVVASSGVWMLTSNLAITTITSVASGAGVARIAREGTSVDHAIRAYNHYNAST